MTQPSFLLGFELFNSIQFSPRQATTLLDFNSEQIATSQIRFSSSTQGTALRLTTCHISASRQLSSHHTRTHLGSTTVQLITNHRITRLPVSARHHATLHPTTRLQNIPMHCTSIQVSTRLHNTACHLMARLDSHYSAQLGYTAVHDATAQRTTRLHDNARRSKTTLPIARLGFRPSHHIATHTSASQQCSSLRASALLGYNSYHVITGQNSSRLHSKAVQCNSLPAIARLGFNPQLATAGHITAKHHSTSAHPSTVQGKAIHDSATRQDKTHHVTTRLQNCSSSKEYFPCPSPRSPA